MRSRNSKSDPFSGKYKGTPSELRALEEARWGRFGGRKLVLGVGGGIVAASALGVGAMLFFSAPSEFEAGQEVPERFIEEVIEDRPDQKVYQANGANVVVDLFEETPESVRADMEARIEAIDMESDEGVSELEELTWELSAETGRYVMVAYRAVASCSGDDYQVRWVFGGTVPGEMQQVACEDFDTEEQVVAFVEERRATMEFPNELEFFVAHGDSPEVSNFVPESDRQPSGPPEGWESPDGEEWVEPETWEGESSEDWKPNEEQLQTHAGEA